MILNVMSYNVLHFKKWHEDRIDYDAFADVIRRSGADVVGLNEVYGSASALGGQTERLAACLGWNAYFAEAFLDDGVDPFGNGIVSRYPITCAETVSIPYPSVRTGSGYYEPRCVLRAKIGGHTFLVTHFGLNPDEQQNALDTVLTLLEGGKCILMGDFNITPDNALLDPLRVQLQDVDAFLPAGSMSFPADKPNKKIDYLFIGGAYTVRQAAVLPEAVSDHRPYFASLEFES